MLFKRLITFEEMKTLFPSVEKKDFEKKFEELFPEKDWGKARNSWKYPRKNYSKMEIDFFQNFLMWRFVDMDIDMKGFEIKNLINPNDKYLREEPVSVGNQNMFDIGRIRGQKYTKSVACALIRIYQGRYGKCLNTGEVIHPVRLFAAPNATQTIDYKEQKRMA